MDDDHSSLDVVFDDSLSVQLAGVVVDQCKILVHARGIVDAEECYLGAGHCWETVGNDIAFVLLREGRLD